MKVSTRAKAAVSANAAKFQSATRPVNSAADPCCVPPECPFPPLRGGAKFLAHAAFFHCERAQQESNTSASGSGPSFAAVIRKVCYADEVDFDAINGNGRWSRFEVVMKAERAERSLS